jgi:hypothetical protein
VTTTLVKGPNLLEIPPSALLLPHPVMKVVIAQFLNGKSCVFIACAVMNGPARAAMTTRRTSLFASISRMALRHDGDGVKLDAMAPEAKSTLIEVDLGERILLLQAWNLENRDAWIRALLEWSGKRRQYVDNEVVFGRRSNLPIVTKP